MAKETLWHDRKRPFLGMPLSFTKYALTEDRLLISSGALNKNEDEIRLYRILDITLKRSFGQRLLGLGTIHCNSADKSMPEFDLKHIKHPRDVRDMLSDLVEKQRDMKRVSNREVFISDADSDSDGDLDGNDI